MAQVLKDQVKNTIINATLQCFAERGFSNTSIAEISDLSGVSIGNIYRYFKGKEDLFNEVLPSSFVESLMKKLRKRVSTYPVGTHPQSIPKEAPYQIFSDELLEFAFSNRLQILILLEGATGTHFESFSDQLCNEWAKNFIKILSSRGISPGLNVLVEKLYKNFLQAIGTILRESSNFAEFQKAERFLTTYHLSGLAALTKWV